MADRSKKFGPDPNRAAEMPFEERHLIAEECVNKIGGRIRHCFRSAFVHLRKAWTLHPVDSEMSMFRAITAEEEAATALILALKQRKYDGAEKLNPRDHVHKNAVSPFLDSVNNLLFETGVPAPKLMISKGDRPKITIQIDVSALTGNPEPLIAVPDHPFNYLLSKDGGSQAYSFDEQIQSLADHKNAKSILNFLQKEANLRNQILYASDEGIPNIDFNESTLLRRRDRVYRLAMLTIGILQTTDHQLFASQCLNAYRAALGHIVEDKFEYEKIFDPDGFKTEIVQQPDGSYSQKFSYKYKTNLQMSVRFLEPIHASANLVDKKSST